MKMQSGIPRKCQNCFNCARYRLPAVTVMGFSYNGCAERFKDLPEDKIRTFRCGKYLEATLTDFD